MATKVAVCAFFFRRIWITGSGVTLAWCVLRCADVQVTVPCHVLQSTSDLAVPLSVSEYIHQHLGGKSVVEILSTRGHLPHVSAPHVMVPALKKHLQLIL